MAIAVVRLRALDPVGGTLTVDPIDCYDGTPLLDIKPWLPSVDIPEGYGDGGGPAVGLDLVCHGAPAGPPPVREDRHTNPPAKTA